MQHIDYVFKAPSAQSWEDAFKAGTTNAVQSKFFQAKPVEELYNTENDPWEVNNIACDPAYEEVLKRMRKAESEWMIEIRDVGLIPEPEYNIFIGEKSMYDYMRSASCPLDKLMRAAELAIFGGPKDLNTFIGYLKNKNSVIRYWGVTGLLILKDAAQPAIPALLETADDETGAVSTLVAETLYGLGEKKAARKIYINILQDTVMFDMTDRNFALNSLDAIDDDNPEVIRAVKKMYNDQNTGDAGTRYTYYDVLMAETLLKKWAVE
jgi:hypothetical protein